MDVITLEQSPPLQAAEIAKTLGIKIYTIGVGKRGKAPFLVDSILVNVSSIRMLISTKKCSIKFLK